MLARFASKLSGCSFLTSAYGRWFLVSAKLEWLAKMEAVKSSICGRSLKFAGLGGNLVLMPLPHRRKK